MLGMTTRRFLGALASAVVALGVFTTAAQAADLEPMSPQMLQQMVLRAQFPRTLGAWEQYLYGAQKNEAPTVCWGAKGPVTLPKAAAEGSVTYQVNQATNGTVSVYQYADAAKATRALTALRAAACTGSPQVPTESETMVTGDQGYDQMDAEFTGLGSAMTYLEPGEGVRGYVSTISTQRGLAIVQTQVRQYVALPQARKQQQAGLDRVGSVNETWHARVLAAYQSFGVEGVAR
jgi:hypothetical protein